MRKMMIELVLERWVRDDADIREILTAPMAQLHCFLGKLPPVFLDELPTGALTGEPLGGGHLGWMWIIKVEEGD